MFVYSALGLPFLNKLSLSLSLRFRGYSMNTFIQTAPLPDCPECSSACYDRYTRKFDRITPVLRQLRWLPLPAANHLQAGNDDLQVPARSGAVLLRWRMYTRFVRRRHSAAAVGQQRNTRRPRTRTTVGRRDLAVSGPGTWNSLPVELRTSSLSFDSFAKNSKLICWLKRFWGLDIHSFIQ